MPLPLAGGGGVGSQRLCEGIRAPTKSRAKFNKDVKIRKADFFLYLRPAGRNIVCAKHNIICRRQHHLCYAQHRFVSAFSGMMFSFAEMMFETAFQNDVVSLRTQTQKRTTILSE